MHRSTKLMKEISLIILLIVFSWGLSHAAEYTCGTNGVDNSCTPAGLASLISSASDGDTIYIAQATHSWTSAVTVNKAITISGGGSYAVSGWNDAGTWPTELTIGYNTAFYINCSSGGSAVVRITGIYFNGSAPFTYTCYSGSGSGGVINELRDNATQYRVDNIKSNSSEAVVATHSGTSGLIDHVYVGSSAVGGHVFHIQRCGSTGEGDDSFTSDVGFGGSDFTFIEDSTVNTTTANSATPRYTLDSQAGGRFVFRYNQIKNAQLGAHGTESGAPLRGVYAQEVYENTIYWTASGDQCHTAYYWRGGPLLFYNNTVTNYQSMIRSWVHRSTRSFGRFGQCDGTKNWDGNGTPIGWPCLDQQGTGKASHSDITIIGFSQEAQKSYIWNNSYSGNLYMCGSPLCNNNPTYVVEGRDYEISEDDSAKPAGYSPYIYPHPLRSGDTTPPSPPAKPWVVE